MKITMLPGEYWYGLAAAYGTSLPLHAGSRFTHRATVPAEYTTNQESPLLVSSRGRYLWSDRPYDVEASDGELRISNEAEDLKLYEGFGTLREAYLAAARDHFPGDGQLPPENFFRKPQYNTWAELIYDQSQKSILGYAHGIIDNHMPPGILMIDDGWMEYYGNWSFNAATFPDPAGMIRELHELGFEVMLWICPFVSADSPEFRRLEGEEMLIRNPDGSPVVRKWWNGYSGILDLSNPKTDKWFNEVLRGLMDLGVDGFKFDAGDVHFYRDEDVTWGNLTPHQECELWCRLGTRYRYNEYRAAYHSAGLPLVQRLCDKSHTWEAVARLVPDALSQGILGYSFGCPDMIGGGSFVDFLPGAKSLDPELFVRYAQVAALMPMMQYSAAPWRVLDPEHADLCRQAGYLHEKFADRIIRLAENAAHTCEPIMRYMEYEFPGQGMEAVTDQFMLGSDILVAPVSRPEAAVRQVILPAGTWEDETGKVLEGGRTVTVEAPLGTLPWFRKI